MTVQSITAPAKIGPNAAIQLFKALEAAKGAEAARAVARAAGCEDWYDHPPADMVSEVPVIRLFRTLEAMHPQHASAIEAQAGRRTADYIIANRIPAFACMVLKRLPARIAGPLLAKAIERHAWTFCGSGTVTVHPGPPCRFEIADNPLTRGLAADRPACAWHTAVFNQLFRRLVHPRSETLEQSCCATYSGSCTFRVAWS
ncbi:MAG: bacteriochlorophyll 4-vinyl reductase [Alphaproteobacteria bacterium]